MRALAYILLISFIYITLTNLALARVSNIEIEQRVLLDGGAEFGAYGQYEKLIGIIEFEFNPDNPHNATIIDLDKAPLSINGTARARANFMVLQPADPKKRRGTGFLEVSNRGGKASMRYFNRATARTGDPTSGDQLGDGLLMRQGLTIIWVGWQYDIPREGHNLWLAAPRALGAGGPITGLVRSDWTLNETAESLNLGHRTLPTFYAMADPANPRNRLTRRDARNGEKTVVEDWKPGEAKDGEYIDNRTHITRPSGFGPGLWEFTYVAENPMVTGIGLAVIRDLAAYAKYNRHSPFPVDKMLGFGVSQTGRFLRHFLFQGFNSDEKGRKAFDGLMIHTAGAGRGSFNHRFAQPSRDAHRFSAFFYPTDLFPFASEPLAAGEGEPRGLFSNATRENLPKIFYTNTGYEYWGRAAGLIHTTPDGSRDTALFDFERIYHLSGGQHFVESYPDAPERDLGNGAYRGLPLDFLVNLRALVVRLAAWVEEDRTPPASRYPTIAEDTLVPVADYSIPAMAGLSTPDSPHSAYAADYGPRWPQGIIDNQPPILGREITPLVPRTDELGNELAGVRNVETRAPLASYITWNLRGGDFAPNELTDFRGTFVPLPLNEEARAKLGDARPSIQVLYKNKANYMARAEAAAGTLNDQGFLLAEDIPYVVGRASELWQRLHRVSGEAR